MNLRRLVTGDRLVVLLALIGILIMLVLPTGFQPNYYATSERARVRVEEVDNSGVYTSARLVMQGSQVCEVRVESGPYRGQRATAVNNFIGRLEIDKVFQVGDRALAVIEGEDGAMAHITLIDHYRLDTAVLLFLAFAALLVGFARWVGAKALLSFVFTILMIWKVLVPAFLRGYQPVVVAMLVVALLTVVIISLVTGLSKRSLVAILGSLAGSALTAVLALIFGAVFRLHGAIMPWAESLLYAGYAHLQLTSIFIAGVFIASAGALMDLAVDISTAMHEIVVQSPGISRRELVKSGFRIGQAVIGTMTTTLLLAYSGGFVALLMVFMAQGTPVMNILNLRYVAAEILLTLVGSFGLVTVAPFTSYIGGLMLRPAAAKVVAGASPAGAVPVPAGGNTETGAANGV